MREIKFKGKTANGEWVFGLPHADEPHSTAYYAEYSQRIAWLLETGGCANTPIKNGTLCQFTGILDKNGAEIFEGDILRYPEQFGISDYPVVWLNAGGWGSDDGMFLHECVDDRKVVGNIHDETRDL